MTAEESETSPESRPWWLLRLDELFAGTSRIIGPSPIIKLVRGISKPSICMFAQVAAALKVVTPWLNSVAQTSISYGFEEGRVPM
jgi:hypothetical protein